MKKWKKIVLIIVLAPFALAIPVIAIASVFGDEAKPEKEVVEKIFKQMNLEEKKIAFNEFINYEKYKNQFTNLNVSFKNVLNSAVKYPETLELLRNNEWIKINEYSFDESVFTVNDYEKGIFTATVHIRSENSYGLKFRERFYMTFIFNGNEDYKVTEANYLK